MKMPNIIEIASDPHLGAIPHSGRGIAISRQK
jgi:hypothetical protein